MHKDKAEVTVNFMGLIGPKGLLPDWYNEYAQQCRHEKDYAFTDFLDIFHNRSLALFYQAWKKYRLPETYRSDHNDPISYSIACLSGIGSDETSSDPEFDQYAHQRLLYFSGLVARTTPTANAVEKIISNAVGAPAKIQQFVTRMYPVHEEDRSILGRNNCGLKKDAMCGGRIQDIGTYFIVKLGPLPWKQYLQLQPKSQSLKRVYQLITRIVGMTYEFEVHLIVKGDDIPVAALGNKKRMPMLGRSIKLGTANTRDSGNVVVKTFQKQFTAPTYPSGEVAEQCDGAHQSVRPSTTDKPTEEFIEEPIKEQR